MKKLKKIIVPGILLLIIISLAWAFFAQQEIVKSQEKAIDEFYQLWKSQIDSTEKLNLIVDSLKNELENLNEKK